MERISVVVPVYNAAQYLERCIDSILNQTYPEIELLLIDDGSNDESGQICDNYAQIDGRVRVVHQENKGVAAARNRGIDLASGNFVTFVDGDDWIEPVMYEQMMRKVEEYSCDVVMCDCTKDFNNKHSVYSHDIRAGYYSLKQLKTEYYPHLLMMENVEYPPTISNWLILYRIRKMDTLLQSSLVRYVEGVRYSEDLLFGAELMLYSNSFYYMKGKVYYHYCFNEKSATNSFVSDKWNDYVTLRRESEKRIYSSEFNFEEQLDKMVLFFLFNSIGDIIRAKELTIMKKISIISKILNDPTTKNMFHHIKIDSLPISTRNKIMTLLYKYRGIYLLLLFKEFHLFLSK